MSTTTCPVFTPTMEEFRDFRKFIAKLEADEGIMSRGICKVIPPKGWFSRSYDNLELTIPHPIRQCVAGRAGVFEVNLFELKPMQIADFQYFASKNSFDCDSFPERERKFWRSLGVACNWDEPIYGADCLGSLFGNDRACSWNVNDLDSILTLMGAEVPGVSNAMLYVGTWRAMFAYHVEDMNLYSINYVHVGAAKSWYSIPSKYRARFENMAQSHFAEEYRECREFLRHKTKLFSPSQLKENGIEYNTVVQNEGEFVITFPGAYHAGFNHGFNIAEATNFATPRWIEEGKKAKRCLCRPFSVSIDMDLLETLYFRQVFMSKSKSRDFKMAKRMRCLCGKTPPLEDASKPVSMDALFCCAACHLYCHKECIYVAPAAVGCGAATHKSVPIIEPAKDLLCHICYSLENEGKWLPSAADAPEETSDAAPLTKTQSLQNSLQSALLEQDGITASKSRKKRCREKFNFKINDTIAISTPGADTDLIGIITDMEDGLGRLHLKGTKRDADFWVTLDETCRVIARDGVAINQTDSDVQLLAAHAPQPPPSQSKKATKSSGEGRTSPTSSQPKTIPVVTPLFPDALFETLRIRLIVVLQKMVPRDFRDISEPVFAMCKIDATATVESVTALLSSLETSAPTRDLSFLVLACSEYSQNVDQLRFVRKIMQRFVSLAMHFYSYSFVDLEANMKQRA